VPTPSATFTVTCTRLRRFDILFEARAIASASLGVGGGKARWGGLATGFGLRFRVIGGTHWFSKVPNSIGFSGPGPAAFENWSLNISMLWPHTRERLANGILLPKSCGSPLVYAVRRNRN
jgi:hypothetical protein